MTSELSATPAAPTRPGRVLLLLLVLIVTAAAAAAVSALLVSIYGHKQAARTPFVRVAEVDEATLDAAQWGKNWPHQHDSYLRTVDSERTEHGGSNALPPSKLESDPWLERLYAGYAFSIDYREARGHAYMLADQEATRRVTEVQQAGACLHCHASVVPTWRRLGLEARGQAVTAETLGAAFDWEAVNTGFEKMSTMPYHDALALVKSTPESHGGPSEGHPVSCVDCHDPETMGIRITRPGFMQGIADLASSDDDVPHLPSVMRWRDGDRSTPYDPNTMASRQEMRTFVCAQCHVEYYCASKDTLFFPWKHGLKVEQIERTFDEHVFPDGSPFADFTHRETGARMYKAQHPEFELWSQGIHARSGVSCSDCHMPYVREGAMKMSSHWVRSPMLNVAGSCQTCHNVPEAELVARVDAIQDRTRGLIDRAAAAMEDMLDAINAAREAGATDAELAAALDLQRKSMWRLDYISSENSKGFHADQEAARILAESIDYARQAEVAASNLRSARASRAGGPAIAGRAD
jgi:nitrite reductase (cytochrome c-552)